MPWRLVTFNNNVYFCNEMTTTIIISIVAAIDDHILSLGGGSGSALGTGGMATKLHAAQVATAAGCEMVIANGQRPELLYDIVAGKPVGTRFLAKEGK